MLSPLNKKKLNNINKRQENYSIIQILYLMARARRFLWNLPGRETCHYFPGPKFLKKNKNKTSQITLQLLGLPLGVTMLFLFCTGAHTLPMQFGFILGKNTFSLSSILFSSGDTCSEPTKTTLYHSRRDTRDL